MKKYLTYLIIICGLMFFIICCEKEKTNNTNEAPTCSIIVPGTGSKIEKGQEILISVEVEDKDKNLKEVIFYIDELSIDSVTSFPYNCNFLTNNIAVGDHIIKAVAIDKNQARTEDTIRVFIIPQTDITFDCEGNRYETVKIGKQWWMKENLRTTKLNDGSEISLITRKREWYHTSKPAYCWYNNNKEKYKTRYGALYNWYTIKTGKLCPDGWHVPSDAEWKILEMFIGMSQSESDKIGKRGYDECNLLKSSEGWGNDNGSDKYGFSALPGGYKGHSDAYWVDSYHSIGKKAYFWSSKEHIDYGVWLRSLGYAIYRGKWNKGFGMSVRCVKDE